MKASLQQKIAPPSNVSTNSISNATSDQGQRENKIDFRSVLESSNKVLKEKKEKIQKEGLSAASDYNEFLDVLNKQTSKDAKTKKELNKDDFLRLFVTQLQNQDPLKPKDGAEMASQLAEFNSLEQMINMNKSLKDMSNNNKSQDQLMWINYIGKQAVVDSNSVEVKNGVPEKIFYNSSNDTENLLVEMKDKKGEVVFSQAIGMVKSGQHSLNWDVQKLNNTKLTDGEYAVSVRPGNLEDGSSSVSLNKKVLISGLDLQDQEKPFKTSVGKLGFSDIKSIEVAENPKEPTDLKKTLAFDK